jgi:RNA polymerase sigma-70 factor (ECF subfamily)
MAALRSGEAAAFDAVYELCAPRLYRFMTRLTGDPELAADLTQETWLRFAAQARALPVEMEPAAWLFRVARNLYISERRRTLLSRARLLELLGWLSGKEETASPFAQLAASESERLLELAIARLPRAQREVFLLVAIEQLEPSQAARVLGIEAEAARQRLSRARARLSQALDAQEVALESAGDEP